MKNNIFTPMHIFKYRTIKQGIYYNVHKLCKIKYQIKFNYQIQLKYNKNLKKITQIQ